jgi:predicted Zn-dependent protease
MEFFVVCSIGTESLGSKRAERYNQGSMSTVNMTPEQAQQAFSELIQSQRKNALWFLREASSISIAQPEADTILESMARVADRSTWLKIRKLKAWRSTRCS